MLDAGVEVTTSDGKKVVVDKGQVLLVEDTWGKGHKSKTVGGGTRNSVFIPIEGPAHYRPLIASKL
jgi:hypothetical protein